MVRHKLSIAIALISLALIVGCVNKQVKIQDNASTNAIAYACGKGMGFSINKLRPDADTPLSESWVVMMEQNAGKEVIEPVYILNFFNSSLPLIFNAADNDPYGLLRDLAVLLAIFSAQFNNHGEMTAISSVPYQTMKIFELGYSSGKALSK